MKNSNEENFKFYPMVEELELILGSPSDPMELISLINKNEFLKMRKNIVDFFNINIECKFTGKFGNEVELGDVSDAVRMTTFGLYPQSTDMDKYIDQNEREVWCTKILDNLDRVVANN
jgi:hypothetical protein